MLDMSGSRPIESVGVSVLVTSYNRPIELAVLLHDLAAQHFEGPLEVIVCDDGSEGSAGMGIARSCQQYGALLVRQTRGGFRAAAARNKGLALARHDLVVFLDDDVRVDRDFVALHREDHVASRRVVVGARIDYDPAWRGASPARLRSLCRGRRDAREEKYGVRFAGPHPWPSNPWKLFYTCNASVGRDLAQRIGGFDETFVGYGLEDNEFAYRLWRAGATFALDGRPAVYHLADPTPRDPYCAARARRAGAADAFDSYVRNAKRFKRKHEEDPAVAFVLDQALDAIESWRRAADAEFRGYRIDLGP